MGEIWRAFLTDYSPLLLLILFLISMFWMVKKGGASKWEKAFERQTELLELQIQTPKETNDLLRKLIASR